MIAIEFLNYRRKMCISFAYFIERQQIVFQTQEKRQVLPNSVMKSIGNFFPTKYLVCKLRLIERASRIHPIRKNLSIQRCSFGEHLIMDDLLPHCRAEVTEEF